MKKRILTLLMAFAMTLAFIPMFSGTDEVYASTNGHTQAEAVSWINGMQGTAIDADGAYGVQCVDLVKLYYQYLGQYLGSIGIAANMATVALPSGWTRDKSPRPGDIAVFPTSNTNSTGHVSLVTEIRGSQFVAIDYNGTGHNDAGAARLFNTGNASAFIHPDFASPANHNPTIAFDGVDVSDGKVHVTGWAYDPDAVAQSIDIHVYLFQNGNPTCIGGTTANVSRIDVDNALHIGQFHGFDATFSTSLRGSAEVQVAAINVGEGVNVWSDKKSITIIDVGSEMTSGYDRTIPDGDYLIVNTASADKTKFYFLDIEGSKVPADSGTNVSLCGPLDGDPSAYDVWKVEYDNGFYTIKQKGPTVAGTNVSLDVWGLDRESGANIKVSEYNGGSNQKWAISRNGNDGYRIQSKCSGYSVDVAGGGTANGTNIQQCANNSSPAQSWLFIPFNPAQTLANGRYVLLSAMDTSVELDIPGDTGDVAENTNVQIWDDGAKSKYNSFDIKKLNNGYYSIIHAASGKGLDLSNAVSTYDGNVALHTANNSVAQQWAITKDGYNGGYMLRVKCSGYALDINGAKTANGTNVTQCPVNYGTNQTWVFVPAEYIVSYNANGGESAPSAQKKYYKENLTLSSVKPTRSRYTFKAWNTKPDGTGASYSPDAKYTSDSNITLYAQWTKDPNPTSASSVTTTNGSVEIVDLPAVKISKPKAAKKSVAVKWKKVSKKNQKLIQGIEIQVATDKNFNNIVKSTTAGKKKTSKKIKGLKSKKTYYVRIRAYKNASDGKHVSAWKTKKVKSK